MVAGAAELIRGMMPARPVEQPDFIAQSLDETELVQLVNRRYEWSRKAKEPLIRTWATCLAFYVGDQYRRWDRNARRLVEPQRIPSWRAQVVDNQIPSICETISAKLAQSRQLPRALTNTDDDEDRAAAIAGTRTLEHWRHTNDIELVELMADIHRMLFGAAFLHDYWDPSKTAKVPVQDPMTGRQMAQRAVVGDVCVELKSVFDVFPEPVEYFNDIRWCIIACRKPLAWFEETFGDKGKNLAPDKSDADVFDSLMPGNSFTQPKGDPTRGDGSATLRVYYELQSPKFPNGRHMMVAGDKLMWHRDQLPMPHGEIPVTMSAYRLVPKRMWPAGPIEGVLGLQSELNRSQNNLFESLRLHARPKWFAPFAAKIDSRAITSAPDEVVVYHGTQRPEQVSPPALPGWVENLPANLRANIQSNVGQHEVSHGSAPPGVTAGVAIQLLQEQDDSRLRVPALLGRLALQRTAKHVLATIVERYREPRLIATLGRGQQDNIMALMGADIGDRDVVIDASDGMADSDGARRQRFFDYNAAGLFNMPLPMQLKVLGELREQWLVDAITEANEQIAEEQAQQQALMGEQGALEMEAAGAEQQAQTEQLAAQEATTIQREQAEAEAQRAHEIELEWMRQQGKMAQTQMKAA